jgi:DNA-binding NarL/FixJ family response regulator
MKALLIDDERLARSELRRLLADFPVISVVGEAANTKQAREQIAALKPDLLFLDVQMPGETGMQLLESLEPPVPEVIFTTAYDEFAVKAFELNALDYLLKPVDPARLAAAIERLQIKIRGTPAAVEKAAPLAAEDKVFVREGDRCWFVSTRPSPSSSARSTPWRSDSMPNISSGPTAARSSTSPGSRRSSRGSAAACSYSSRAAPRLNSAAGRRRNSARR